MYVVFRFDATDKIGMGHLSRCLSISRALKKNGAKCQFIVSHDSIPFVKSSLRQEQKQIDFETWRKGSNKHNFFILEDILITPINPDLDIFATRSKAVISTTAHWLVVDHYKLDERWHKCIKPSVEKILVIDDEATKKFSCNILVNPAGGIDWDAKYKGLVPIGCKLLFGLKYSLISESCTVKKLGYGDIKNYKIKKILVFFGAADGARLTLPCLERILASNLKNALVDVVLSGTHPDISKIEKLKSIMPNLNMHDISPLFPELVRNSDLVIGAGGVAAIERCALGVPSISVSVNNHQSVSLNYLQELGLTKYLGSHEIIYNNDFTVYLDNIYLNYNELYKQIEAFKSGFCFKGVEKVVFQMVNSFKNSLN